MSDSVRVPAWLVIASPLAPLLAFILGQLIGGASSLPEPQASALRLVHQEIGRSYVDATDPGELLDRALAAMAQLDDYSEYVPPRHVPQFLEQTTGSYEGIGMAPHWADDGAVFVRNPFAGGPADRAGLLPGDRILAIDEVVLADLPRDTQLRASERLRGPAGSTVRLRVERSGAELTIAVERGAVQKASVKWTQRLAGEPELGYVHLADFHPGCSQELEAAIRGLLAAGPLRGLMLDLRFDGGGNFEECLRIARLFLQQGNITTLRRRGSEVVERHDASGTASFADLSLVLLVNEDTASASEVLAGALQDHGRAAIVGVATYGKGHVNTVFQWRDLDFRLKLTTASYFTPAGRNLDRGRQRHGATAPGNGAAAAMAGGITPDRVVLLDAPVQARLRQALTDQPVAERHREPLRTWSAARDLPLPGPLPADQDPQFAAALAALRERAAAPPKDR